MENIQKRVIKKIMIIVWKWRDMERVNELIWDEKKFDFYSNHVEEGEVFFLKNMRLNIVKCVQMPVLLLLRFTM